MTCIVGLVEDGAVWIGSDSQCSMGYVTQVLARPKIVRTATYLLGYSGSVRLSNLLQHALTVPPRPEDMEVEAYLSTLFVDALRTLLKETGVASKDKEREESPGLFLVAIAGRLFRISMDYSVIETAQGFDAIGSGNEVALGALYATKDLSVPPERRLMEALEAASHYIFGVGGPLVIERWHPEDEQLQQHSSLQLVTL